MKTPVEQEADWIDEVCNTWKIDPDYTFSMQSVYFTADGKKLTFREVLLAGYARAQERQWIKCSEQLPEPYKQVAVRVGSKGSLDIGSFDCACNDWDLGKFGSVVLESVTHWQELPPPPPPPLDEGAK